MYEHFLPPDTHKYVYVSGGKKYSYVCVSWGKKHSFFGKFGALCFIETLVLRFALLPYYQRIIRIYCNVTDNIVTKISNVSL